MKGVTASTKLRKISKRQTFIQAAASVTKGRGPSFAASEVQEAKNCQSRRSKVHWDKSPRQTRCNCNSTKTELPSQGGEQFAGSRLIIRAIPIGDAFVDGGKNGNGFVNPALFMPETGQIDGCAQFKQLCALLTGDL